MKLATRWLGALVIVAAAATRLRTLTWLVPLNTTPFWFTTITVPSPLMAPWIWLGAVIMALGGVVSLTDRRWRVGVAANYLDAMRTVAGRGAIPAGEGTDSAVVWDLSAGYRVNERLELYGRVENLADETYVVARRPAGLRPGQPRATVLGLRYQF